MGRYFKVWEEELNMDKVIFIEGLIDKNMDVNKEQIFWNDVLFVIDFVMFWIYMFVYCISIIVIMVILIK